MRRLTVPPPLTGPYAVAPSDDAIAPAPATVNLVRSQVRALLQASPVFHEMAADSRKQLAHHLVKIAAYAAELIRDDWYQSEQLGQRPVVRHRQVLEPVVEAQAAADDFQPAAASQVGRITRETLQAISFPTFVADLINGTFNAITNATMREMEAYAKLLKDVSKTVDQFMSDNVSNNQARDWLADSYPEHIAVEIRDEGPRLVPRPGAEDRPPPSWQSDLNLSGDVGLDEDEMEEILIPAARRSLAQNRLQMLSTLVLMGMNRIVVTAGKIRATMQFHIDTTDRAQEQRATDFDFRTSVSGSFGYGPWSVSASTSVAYVSSVRSESESEINLEANLTGEVEIHFRSDYFPLSRFANAGAIQQIQGNTAVPEANTPNLTFGTPVAPLSPRPRRTSSLQPLPALRTADSAPLLPAEPRVVEVPRRDESADEEEATAAEGSTEEPADTSSTDGNTDSDSSAGGTTGTDGSTEGTDDSSGSADGASDTGGSTEGTGDSSGSTVGTSDTDGSSEAEGATDTGAAGAANSDGDSAASNAAPNAESSSLTLSNVET